ncbi:MAG: hypothetical protein HC930_02230 [Hydrococcus sp. SU_1_0]|nr:hypothetical protein [Hydrococcus sp. SU_1_0]
MKVIELLASTVAPTSVNLLYWNASRTAKVHVKLPKRGEWFGESRGQRVVHIGELFE